MKIFLCILKYLKRSKGHVLWDGGSIVTLERAPNEDF